MALGAMTVATGIIGDARMSTVLATLDVPAERGRAASLDCRHDAELAKTHMAGIRRPPCLPVAAENIRHLQLGSEHVRRIKSAVPPEASEAQADFGFAGSY